MSEEQEKTGANAAAAADPTSNAGGDAAKPEEKTADAPKSGAGNSAQAAGGAGLTAGATKGDTKKEGDLFSDDKELLAAIAEKTGEKITKEYMDSRIAQVSYGKQGATTLICVIILDNGFTAIGESACVDPANFDEKIGKTLSYKRAYEKLWPLFGFLLAEARHLRK